MLAQLNVDWSMWTAPFSTDWGTETLCSALVCIACGVLGCFVVLRRMALIGDALSHAVLPGVVVAFLLTRSANIVGLFLGALAAGLVTAVLINVVSRQSRTKDDSAIGIVFTAFFALGIVLISMLPRGTHFDLQCFLFGDPLAVGRQDVLMMLVVAPLVIAVVTLLYHPLKISSFDPVVASAMGLPVSALHYLLMGLLAATVVAGLKTTGVILVVAMVITPASAAYQLTNRLWSMLVLSGLFGAVSAVAGMSLAFVTNSPTGPAMVVVATLLFVLCMLLSPSHGVLIRLARRRSVARHIGSEDVLKSIFKLSEQGRACTTEQVSARINLPPARVRRLARILMGEKLLKQQGTTLTLTDAGMRRAIELVRAHRLWESYLAERAGVDYEAVHEQAEHLEHAHELADEVDESLGHPERDPHGEVIPQPGGP